MYKIFQTPVKILQNKSARNFTIRLEFLKIFTILNKSERYGQNFAIFNFLQEIAEIRNLCLREDDFLIDLEKC